jgi:hypothetical protein
MNLWTKHLVAAGIISLEGVRWFLFSNRKS